MDRIRAKKGFICDMDGVIYHGNRLLDGVTEFVEWMYRENKEFLFLTNNSGKTPRELRQKLDLTVLIIEHHMEVVMKLCDHIYVLNLGSLLREGKPAEIQSDPQVIKAYLGEKRRRN